MSRYILWIFYLIQVTFAGTYLNPIEIIDLKQWSVQYGNDKENTTEVSIPNGIFSIARQMQLIEDVLYLFNDESSKWISEKNWTFTYDLSDVDLSHNNVLLVLDGIDVIAEIKINDVSVGTTQNMFKQYSFDIKDYLVNGNNVIEIILEPSVKAADEANARQNTSYGIPRECPPSLYHGDCHVNMLRKMQASFSSSTSPSIPSQGIWKPVKIFAYKESFIQHLVADVEDLNDTFWRINIDVYLAPNKLDPYIFGRMNLILDGKSYGNEGYWIVDVTANEYGEIVWSNYLDINKTTVDLWWPNGYGEQKLYNLTVQYCSSEIIETHSMWTFIGFRTIELVQEQMGNGLTFYFKVNNVPIFMKGSNLIPIDILPEYIDDTTIIEHLITGAADCYMNMLRIWGGSTYASDYLYDLADQLGILIWQEYMFADSLYPASDDFLNNVRDEVRYQVKRLYSHPSLALFSGNSEIEQAIAENRFNLADDTVYRNDYIKLFVNTIKEEYKRITHGKGIFLMSSPSNGAKTESDNYISGNPSDELYGDIHYFNYAVDPFNHTLYPVPRFVSAYGHQSLPNTESILKQAGSDYYLNFNTDWLIYRQHQSEGFDEIMTLVTSNLEMTNVNDSYYYLQFIFYTEIIQAQAVKLQTEHYRIHRSTINNDFKGKTMGALYWHLNDVWVGPTWSGIDYFGRWKPVQYFIKDAFAPVIITGQIVDDSLNIYTVSDLLESINGVTLRIQVYQWTSFTSVNETSISQLEVIPNSSNFITTFNYVEMFSNTDCTKTLCFFYLTLELKDDLVAPSNVILPAKIKNCELVAHYIYVTSVKLLKYQTNIYEVTIHADTVALFVWLDAHEIDGKFSENGFLLLEPTKTVYFYSGEDTTEEDLLKMISVTHIRDSRYGSESVYDDYDDDNMDYYNL